MSASRAANTHWNRRSGVAGLRPGQRRPVGKAARPWRWHGWHSAATAHPRSLAAPRTGRPGSRHLGGQLLSAACAGSVACCRVSSFHHDDGLRGSAAVFGPRPRAEPRVRVRGNPASFNSRDEQQRWPARAVYVQPQAASRAELRKIPQLAERVAGAELCHLGNCDCPRLRPVLIPRSPRRRATRSGVSFPSGAGICSSLLPSTRSGHRTHRVQMRACAQITASKRADQEVSPRTLAAVPLNKKKIPPRVPKALRSWLGGRAVHGRPRTRADGQRSPRQSCA